MNYGMYLSASGMLTNMYRQDVFANNLANAKTVGFKVDEPTIAQRAPEAIEDGFGVEVSNRLLETIGGGVLAGPQRINFSPGQLQHTGNPFDFALDSPKTFFNIQHVDENGEQRVMLSRDGRFTRDKDGFLVTMSSGKKVLDHKDKPIVVPGEGVFAINESGHIYVDNEKIGTLGVSGVTDTDKLTKFGQNLFTWGGSDDIRTQPQHAPVRQNHIETSAVDPIKTLMKLVSATKAANGSANMIRYHDQLMQQAVNTLGRVA